MSSHSIYVFFTIIFVSLHKTPSLCTLRSCTVPPRKIPRTASKRDTYQPTRCVSWMHPISETISVSESYIVFSLYSFSNPPFLLLGDVFVQLVTVFSRYWSSKRREPLSRVSHDVLLALDIIEYSLCIGIL